MEEDFPKDVVTQERSLLCDAKKNTEQTSTTLEDGEASDPELEELLDKSLGEFGKHVPQPNQQLDHSATVPSKAVPTSSDQGESELDGLLSSEFMSEMESQLGETMKMLSDENPELWQQLNTFTKSMGLEDLGLGSVPPPSGASTKGESSVDANSGATSGAMGGARMDGGDKTDSDCLDHMLDKTLKNLQEDTSQSEAGGLGGLGDVLGQLDLDSEEGDDQFMKMMQGMMSTLLSKEVLYPSLMDLCKQYPDWIASHRSSLSEEDFKRYSKQMEIMTAICSEFEKPSEGAEPCETTSEKILQLMQELQRQGQLPEGVTGDVMNHTAAEWVRKNAFSRGKPNMTAQMFCAWVNEDLLPSSHLPPNFPRSISLRTSMRWLHHLGFKPVSHKKGVYIDGHEREDVVKHRKAGMPPGLMGSLDSQKCSVM